MLILNETQTYIVEAALKVYTDDLIARLDNHDWQGHEIGREDELQRLKETLDLRLIIDSGDTR